MYTYRFVNKKKMLTWCLCLCWFISVVTQPYCPWIFDLSITFIIFFNRFKFSYCISFSHCFAFYLSLSLSLFISLSLFYIFSLLYFSHCALLPDSSIWIIKVPYYNRSLFSVDLSFVCLVVFHVCSDFLLCSLSDFSPCSHRFYFSWILLCFSHLHSFLNPL